MVQFFRFVVVILTGSIFLAACGSDEAIDAGAKKRKGGDHLVQALVLQPATYRYSTTHTGSLRASRSARLFSLEEGRVLKIHVYEGDRVREGQVLVQLDDDLLKAEFEKVEANRKQAEQDVKRLQELLAKSLGSRDELEQAQTALAVARGEENVLRTRLQHTRIVAPFTGVISQRLVEAGDVVAKHTHLLSIYDPESLITEVRVSELLLPNLAVGDGTDVIIDALGDTRFKASIFRIHPTVDPNTRRGTVEVELKPVPAGATAGQLCRIIIYNDRSDRLLIPFSALQRDLESEYVLVVNDKGEAEQVRIQTGLRQQEHIEVVQGLQAGQKVIVRGFFGLSPGKKVKVVNE